jgi:hypothetical protein
MKKGEMIVWTGNTNRTVSSWTAFIVVPAGKTPDARIILKRILHK